MRFCCSFLCKLSSGSFLTGRSASSLARHFVLAEARGALMANKARTLPELQALICM